MFTFFKINYIDVTFYMFLFSLLYQKCTEPWPQNCGTYCEFCVPLQGYLWHCRIVLKIGSESMQQIQRVFVIPRILLSCKNLALLRFMWVMLVPANAAWSLKQSWGAGYRCQVISLLSTVIPHWQIFIPPPGNSHGRSHYIFGLSKNIKLHSHERDISGTPWGNFFFLLFSQTSTWTDSILVVKGQRSRSQIICNSFGIPKRKHP